MVAAHGLVAEAQLKGEDLAALGEAEDGEVGEEGRDGGEKFGFGKGLGFGEVELFADPGEGAEAVVFGGVGGTQFLP